MLLSAPTVHPGFQCAPRRQGPAQFAPKAGVIYFGYPANNAPALYRTAIAIPGWPGAVPIFTTTGWGVSVRMPLGV
jgi:hypothetical protein